MSSVVSTDGTQLWTAARSCCGNTTGGVRHTTLGATTSTQLSDTDLSHWKALIFDGQLYVSGFEPDYSVGKVGSGLPTRSDTTITNLPGLPATQIDRFFLADLDAAAVGPDTLYVAGGTGSFIRRFNLVDGVWVHRGDIVADFAHHVIGKVSGSKVTLYITISCARKSKDVNKDGLKDLICSFDKLKAAFQAGDTEGTLKGDTTDVPAKQFVGTDAVRITP